MYYFADLHIHSKFSRATSRDCDLEHLAFWACKKGISVVGTGDFTHPGWRAEIRDKLVPAEPGLFRLRPDIESEVTRRLPKGCSRHVRFALTVEISNVYKKAERTRKVHNLVLVEDLTAAESFVASLSRIGNLTSDGRPILGLDSRDLLEIVLQSGDGSYLVPAHIWTPWFSALGSKSGFDSIDECYGDLASHVFAVETGLSSDPPMNWRLSSLDRFRLISNSDAHSPQKLGREACSFDTDLSYFAMRDALKTGNGYRGTVEFFPEEGKYHLDGHRKCQVRQLPEETRRTDGKCPSCGRPVTVGVAHRVAELADRPADERPAHANTFRSFIPLPEVLAELLQVGAQSRRVAQAYERVLSSLGPELQLLEEVPKEDIAAARIPLLAEAIERMRRGDVRREAGYDGEYGVIRLFAPDEIARPVAVATLFDLSDEAPATKRTSGSRCAPPPMSTQEPATSATPTAPSLPALEPAQNADNGSPASTPEAETETETLPPILAALDPEQRAAAKHPGGPMLIVAGPGTGKTRTLTHRIAYLVSEGSIAPHHVLAMTYTRKAAEEMRERLFALIPEHAAALHVMTFHRLGLLIVEEQAPALGMAAKPRLADDAERLALIQQALGLSQSRARQTLEAISRWRRACGTRSDAPELADAWQAYRRQLRLEGLVDFDDLLALPVALLEGNPDLRDAYRERFQHILVDEYQDVDELQYQLCKHLVPADGNLCAIGDPDQAIYGFRGADVRFFLRFSQDFPSAHTVRLQRNYRSTPHIVQGALQVMTRSPHKRDRSLAPQTNVTTPIRIQSCATDRAEAESVVHTIEQLIGGHSFFSMDSGRTDGSADADLSFSDFAVLYRTAVQADLISEALRRSGFPFQRRSHQRLSEVPAVCAIIDALRESAQQESTTSTPLPTRLQQIAQSLSETSTDAGATNVSCEALQEAAALLMPLCQSSGDDVERFMSELALRADIDLWDPRADRISLLTLHASKGLEFRVVFVVGCEDGILPLSFGDKPIAETEREEERRLFFVGMTRAEERLFLMRAEKRLWRGKTRSLPPSPFLKEVGEALKEQANKPSKPKKPKAPVRDQLSLF